MPRTLLRLLAVLAAATLLLGACGDDDGGSSDDDATTTTTEAPADLDEETDGGDDTDGDTTDTTEEASGGSTGGVPDAAALARIGDFCELFGVMQEVEDPFDAMDDPTLATEDQAAAVEQAFTFVEALFTRATQLAPGEIKADVALFAEYMGEWNSLLAEYDYDFVGVAMAAMDNPELEERFAGLESDDFEAASERVEAYVQSECGITLPD